MMSHSDPADDRVTIAGGGRYIADAAAEALDTEQQVAIENRPAGVTSWLFAADQEASPLPLSELTAAVGHDANFVWVDLSEYGERNLVEIAGLLHLPDTATRSALSSWQRPHVDIAAGSFSVSVTVARLDPDRRRVQANQLDLFVGRNFLASTHKLPLPFADRILDRARHSPELVRLDSAYMLYIVLDELISYHQGLYELVQGEMERMEERALADTSDAFLEEVVHFKRYVFALGQLVDQHRSVFSAFLRPDFPYLSNPDVEPYFRDLATEQDRLASVLSQAATDVNTAFDIYVSHMTHRTNQVIKTLTVVSILLLPISLVLTFFGTSFRGLPLYGLQGFIAMVVLSALIAAGSLIAIRRRGWL